MFSFPTFSSINQILNATHHFNYETNYEERRMVVCCGPGSGSQCVCVCVWMEGDVCGISGSSQAVNSQLKPGLCLWSAWSKRKPGAAVGHIGASYATTHQPPVPYPDCPHSLEAYACLCVVFFRQIAAQISETDLCYRNTIWLFAGFTRSQLYTWNIRCLFVAFYYC